MTDTPGTNDPDMDAATWIAGFRKEAEKNTQPIHMVLVAFKANTRPDRGQMYDLLSVFEAIANFDPRNIGVIFTFCD